MERSVAPPIGQPAIFSLEFPLNNRPTRLQKTHTRERVRRKRLSFRRGRRRRAEEGGEHPSGDARHSEHRATASARAPVAFEELQQRCVKNLRPSRGRPRAPRPTRNARFSARIAVLKSRGVPVGARASVFLLSQPRGGAERARPPKRATHDRPVPSPQTINMADEGEVSALVCDNGSGMVKVRVRSPPRPGCAKRSFWLQRSSSNVGSTTPRSQRARARSEASDARASFPDHLPSPLARSPSRFHPSRAIASARPRDHPERTSDARSAVVPIDPRRDARVSRLTARPRSFELTDSPPTVAPSLPSRLVSPATTPPAPSSPPSWVAPATRA